ncbi:MAG: hypothetical protein FWE57_10190, partial [Chitinispirillia bacterium]|nr:hypothetical protein [Chitinispirillia bacterium]
MGRERKNRRHAVIKAFKAAALILAAVMMLPITAIAADDQLGELTVYLTAGDGKVTLGAQDAVPAHTFMYKTTVVDDTENKPNLDETAYAIDWTGFDEDADIPGTNGTKIFVQVIQVSNGSNAIKAWGQASAIPAAGDLIINYTLFLHTDGRLYKDNEAGEDITAAAGDGSLVDNGSAIVTGSAGEWILTLNGLEFETTAPVALKVPDGTTIFLVPGTESVLTSELDGDGSAHAILVGGGAESGMAIDGSGLLTASVLSTAGGVGASASAIKTNGTITIRGGTITARGGVSNGESHGICGNIINIRGGSVVTASGGAITSATAAAGTHGINGTAAVNISGGTVTASGGVAAGLGDVDANGIAGTLTMGGFNTVVTAIGGTSSDDGSEIAVRDGYEIPFGFIYILADNANGSGNPATGTVTTTPLSTGERRYVKIAAPEASVITITEQPASSMTVTAGSISAELTILAEVTQTAALSYQWYINTTDSNEDGVAVEGAASAGFAIPADLTYGTHYFYCIVSATGGARPDTSGVAAVTVNSAVIITTHPVENTVVAVGSVSGSLFVSADVTGGASLSYQWFSNTANSNEGGTWIEDATSAIFTIPADLEEGTHYFFCEVSATGGAISVTSNVAAVEAKNLVIAAVPTVTVTVEDKILAADGSKTYLLKAEAAAADGGTLTYQWFVNTENSTVGAAAVTGATASEFTAPYDENGTFYYFAEVTNTIEDNGDGGQKTAYATSEIIDVEIDITRIFAGIMFLSPKSIKEAGADSIAVTNAASYMVEIAVVNNLGEPFTDDQSSHTINLSIRIGNAATSRIMRTDPATGIARFDASLAGSSVGNEIRFTARSAINGEVYNDTADLRIVQRVSVLTADRIIPKDNNDKTDENAAKTVFANEFTAGPNVAGKGGTVNIFRQGESIRDGVLMIYDASGNVVSRIAISDGRGAVNRARTDDADAQSRRIAGSWNLKDTKGR